MNWKKWYLPEGLGYGDGSDGTVAVVRQPLDALHVDPIVLHRDLGLGTFRAALPRRLSRRLNLVKSACLRIQYARDFSLLLRCSCRLYFLLRKLPREITYIHEDQGSVPLVLVAHFYNATLRNGQTAKLSPQKKIQSRRRVFQDTPTLFSVY